MIHPNWVNVFKVNVIWHPELWKFLSRKKSQFYYLRFKILTDEQTRGWFTEIHSAIQRRNIELVHLLVLTLQNDLFNFDLVQILAHLWNPNSYFFVKNKFGDSSPPSYKASMQGSNEDEDETPEVSFWVSFGFSEVSNEISVLD